MKPSSLSVPGVEGVAAVEEGAEVTGTAAGAAGAWEELILGAPPGEGVTVADWLRELRRRSTGEQRGRLHVCVRVCVCIHLTWMRSCWSQVLHPPAGWRVPVLLELPGLLRQRHQIINLEQLSPQLHVTPETASPVCF